MSYRLMLWEVIKGQRRLSLAVHIPLRKTKTFSFSCTAASPSWSPLSHAKRTCAAVAPSLMPKALFRWRTSRLKSCVQAKVPLCGPRLKACATKRRQSVSLAATRVRLWRSRSFACAKYRVSIARQLLCSGPRAIRRALMLCLMPAPTSAPMSVICYNTP